MKRALVSAALITVLLATALAASLAGAVTADPGEINIDIQVSPDMGEYLPGQRINSVTVSFSYPSGAPIDAVVSGSLEPNKTALIFSGSEGVYTADIGYKVMSSDKRLLELNILATAAGKTISAKKFLLAKTDSARLVRINSPAMNAEVAPGQPIRFGAEVSGAGDVLLIDESSGEGQLMAKVGSVYSYSLSAPTEMGETASFIVYAPGEPDGAERIALKKKPVLFLEKNSGEQDTEKGRLAFLVRYVSQNGELIGSNLLNAEITSYPSGKKGSLALSKEDETFVGTYRKVEGDTSAKITVNDEFGNTGEADIPPEFFSVKWPESEGLPIFYIAVVLIAVGGIVAAFALRPKKAAGPSKKEELKVLEAEKERLEADIKQTKLDFYKHKIESDAANKRITEAEEKLGIVKKKLEGMEK